MKGGVGMHPRGATSSGKYAFQLSYQENGEEKSGWLGKKQVHGKDSEGKDVTIDVAVFVPEKNKNELPSEALVLEEVNDPTRQRFYRIPGAPENEHCSQHLYLSIITDGNENMVGFSGCWGASSWDLQQFIPQWFAGTTDKEQKDDQQKYQAEARDKNKPQKLNLTWLPSGKRLASGKDNTGKPDPRAPLVCLCDPVKPTVKNGEQLRDKPDNRVLTVNLILSSAPQPRDGGTTVARKKLVAKAANIAGHVSSLSGVPKVTITGASDNKPVAGLPVSFVTATQKIEGCSASTDSQGVAECESGTHFSPTFVTDALASGYDAVFAGDEEYEPVTAHGKVTVGI
jgi:hypothetical protein